MNKIALITLCIMTIYACNRDKIDSAAECETEVTYTNEIRDIMLGSCAYSGCHLNGAAPGDYSTYDGMMSSINSNEMAKRVLEIQNMPPEYAVAPNPKELTDLEIQLFTCWVQNDYTE